MKPDFFPAFRPTMLPVGWSLAALTLVLLLADVGCSRSKPPPASTVNPIVAVSNAYPSGVTNHFKEFDKSCFEAAEFEESERPARAKASKAPPKMERAAPAPAESSSRAIPDPMDIK